MKCPACGHENAEGQKFCGECGARLKAVCADCGAHNPLGQKFCGECDKPLGAPAAAETPAPPVPSQEMTSPSQPLAVDTTRGPQPPGGLPQVDAGPQSPDRILTTRAAVQGERRLVTILFADVSGFTAMSQKLDHETVNQIMRACWAELDQVVVEHGGTVDKHIGDALMATFGATVAHEDDPLAAVRTSLTLQGRLAAFSQNLETATGLSLRMHSGIASGEVTVDQVADSTQELSVIGPAVNLASRLEGQCEAGQVFVSEEVFRATEWAIEYRAIEPRAIKGIEGLVPIYEPISERESTQRGSNRPGLAKPEALIGRQREQEQLRAALDDAVAGRGRVVALVGDGGMGKSTLAWALHRAAAANDVRWVDGHCLSYASTHPYALVREVVEHLLEIPDGASQGTVLACLEAALAVRVSVEPAPLEALVAADGGGASAKGAGASAPMMASPEAPRAGDGSGEWNAAALTLTDRQALIAQVLLGQGADGAAGEALGALDPPTRHRLTVQAFSELLLDQGRQRPLVLNLEDLYWCDPESREIVGTVTRALGRQPLLLLFHLRPDSDPVWLALPRVIPIRLEPMTAEDTLSLVRSALDVLAPDGPQRDGLSRGAEPATPVSPGTPELGAEVLELAARLHEETDGNPYFIVEMVLSLTESEQLVVADGRWQLAGGAQSVVLPSGIRQLLLARMDTLDPVHRLILEEAAVIGLTFERRVVAAISEAPPAVPAALEVLSSRGFVIPTGQPTPDTYECRHGLVRDVAYETLARWRREMYHGRAGEYLEGQRDPAGDAGAVNLLAHHFTHSTHREKAVRYALLAAESAAGQYANQEALSWFDAAHEALEALERPSGVEALGRLGLQIAGKGANNEGLGREELEDGWMRLLEGRAATEMLLASLAEAREHLEAALARCDAAPDLLSRQAPELHRRLARVGEAEGDYERALQCVERGLGAAGAAWPEGEDRWLAGPEQLDAGVVARLCLMAGLVHHRRGRPAEAGLWARRAVALAEPAGEAATQDLAQAFNLLSLLAKGQGRPDDAESFARRSLELYEGIGDLPGADKAHSAVAFALKDRGELNEALAHLLQSKEIAARIGDPVRKAAADINMGEIYLRQGDLPAARGCYEDGLELSERAEHRAFAALSNMNLACVYGLEGEGTRALAFAEAAREEFVSTGAVGQLPEALCYQAGALRLLGRLDEARAAAEEALTGARSRGQRPYEGQALRTLGQVRAAAGEWAEAARLLEESCSLFEELDARYELGRTLLEHARLLAESGGSPPNGVTLLDLCARAAELLRAAGAARDLAVLEALRRALTPQ